MKQFGLQDRLYMPQVEHSTTGHEYFSLADAGQVEDEIIEGYRGEVDANAALPPLPHDVYAVRVRYADRWPGAEGEALADDPARRWRKQFAADGSLMYLTWIRVVTENNADPAHDGRERQEVLTTYMSKNGTTQAQALLQGLGQDTVTLNSHQAQMAAIDALIAGEGALAGQELDWEATVFDKDMAQLDKKTKQPKVDGEGKPKLGVELFRLRGMKKFPKDGEGNYVPELSEDDGFSYAELGADGKATGSKIPVKEARARNFARRWVPIGKLQQGSQLEQQLQESVQQVNAGKAQTAPAAAPARTNPAPAAARPAAQAAPAAPTQTRPAAGRPPVRRVTA